MQRFFFSLILFTLLLVPVGCTPTIQGVPLGTPVPWSPTLAKDDPIKTYAQYKQAVEDAEKKVPPTLAETVGLQRLIAYTQEIAKLRSRQSRDYANALAFKLLLHGVSVHLPPATGDLPTISYSELAIIDALTEAVIRGPDPEKNKHIPDAQLIPMRTLNTFYITIAQYCPSDWGATDGAMGFFDHPSDVSDQPTIGDFLFFRGETRRAEGLVFNRRICPWRRMNLTSLVIYDNCDIFSNEGLGYYSFAIGYGFYVNALGQLTKPALHGLIDAMVDSAKRAKSIDPSPETQKMLNDFIADRGDPKSFPSY